MTEHLVLNARSSLDRLGHIGRSLHRGHILVHGENLSLQGGIKQYLTIGTGLSSYASSSLFTATPT